MLLLLLLQAQDEGARTADVPNAMGAHTWFIIVFAAAFLAWSISYSLQLRKDALARKKGRDDLVKRKDELIDRIANIEAEKEAGRLDDKKYKQEWQQPDPELPDEHCLHGARNHIGAVRHLSPRILPKSVMHLNCKRNHDNSFHLTKTLTAK